MAIEKLLVDLDLSGNQILNASLQNLTTHPTTIGKLPGWIYWNTTLNSAFCYTGKLAPATIWLDLGDIYVHPDAPVITPVTLTGNKVLASLIFDAKGHVVGATDRALTPLEIGASAIGHTHALSDINGVTVTLAQLNLLNFSGKTKGQVLAVEANGSSAIWRTLLGSEITNDKSWVKIEDGLTNAVDTWSSTKIQGLINELNDNITGGLVNKGGYNAITNTPKLSTTPIAGIKNGWTYIVTQASAGLGSLFFTEYIQVGDMLIANKDSPTTLAHWTIVNKNIPDIVDASLTNKGIIMLANPATEALATTGHDNTKALTVAGLAGRTATTARTGILALATLPLATAGADNTTAITPLILKGVLDARTGGKTIPFGNGTLTTFVLFHGLNSLDVVVDIIESANNETVRMQVQRTDVDNITIFCNNVPATNQYKAIIKK